MSKHKTSECGDGASTESSVAYLVEYQTYIVRVLG